MTIKTKTDLELHEDILEELALEPRLRGTEIASSVKGAVVTLTGTVPSLLQKWLAEATVSRVRGVRGIAEELTVELPDIHQRTDSDIARAIQARIEWDQFLPRGVQVVVTGGVVTLNGEADWHYQISELEKMVRSLTGVRTIHNHLKVRDLPTPSTEDVKSKIHSLFARAADFDADMVEISVSPGEITLKGFVRSCLERDKAAQAAWSLPGVQFVDNEITVLA